MSLATLLDHLGHPIRPIDCLIIRLLGQAKHSSLWAQSSQNGLLWGKKARRSLISSHLVFSLFTCKVLPGMLTANITRIALTMLLTVVSRLPAVAHVSYVSYPFNL